MLTAVIWGCILGTWLIQLLSVSQNFYELYIGYIGVFSNLIGLSHIECMSWIIKLYPINIMEF